MSNNKVSNFYDNFISTQIKLSYNERHFLMLKKLIERNLNGDSKILELGCGIGVITSLINQYEPNCQIDAVDISGASIEYAKSFHKSKNVNFLQSDIVEFEITKEYDFVCLFDVIEHIPINRLPELFNRLKGSLTKDTRILINIPSEEFLNYLKLKRPNELQIIDNAIPTNELINLLSSAGLDIISFEKYDLFYKSESRFLEVILKNEEFAPKINKIKIERFINLFRVRKHLNKLLKSF